MGNAFSQFFFIPSPALTEKNCPDQTGRVFLITGGYGGVGFELSKILYRHNAVVWMAGRSEPKAKEAIANIQAVSPGSKGQLKYLPMDLSDLTSIKPAVEAFTAQESRVDVLVNNAAVMYPPEGSTDAQGNDLQMGTNCLGHYLLYQLLRSLLAKTASDPSTAPASVRVLWAASIAVHVATPAKHGIVVGPDGRPADLGIKANYAQTKVGNVFLARELARTTGETGIVHVSFNPGNLRTGLQRHWTGLDHWITDSFVLHQPINGAYTELWAALDPELTLDRSGAYVYPWGRIGTLPDGIEGSLGRDGVAARFAQWCESQTRPFL
ncbi:NAD(P)-binding protein [Xylariomycetidae sp. FL2044]|nr:NAD(P)-binding protein [Xylariomycetidae sp. FL2044]